MVYLRDFGVRGRHKLHDKWSPVLYQVLKAPVGDGVVYTIAPAEELHKARHRDAIKARVGTNICLPSLHSPPASTAPVISSDSPEEGKLWLLTCDGSALPVIEAIVSPCPTGSAAAPPVIAALDSVPSVEPEHTESVASSAMDQHSPAGPALRRTGRATAGQHSNVHHLPQSMSSRG